MEDKLSKMLYELNSEYIELANSKGNKRRKNFSHFKNSLSKLNFQYLLDKIASIKKTKKKYTDDLTRFQTEPSRNEALNTFGDGTFSQSKIAVYTCITSDYDNIMEPIYCNANCDYYIVTDKDVPKDSYWTKIDINQFKLNYLKSNEKNRFIKLHPHLLFQDYDYSLYVDGNIRIMADIVPLVAQMGNSVLGVHRHNKRDCIYTEANVIVDHKRFAEFRDMALKQIEFYKQEGLKEHQGLYENPILIRKHNDKKCIELMNAWWGEMNRFTMRDQLSLPYVLWKFGIKEDDICILGNNVKMNPRFRKYTHNMDSE
ncbi:MAG: Eps11P family protein [Clostridia bacterium]|jgi:hypothetical protein|nr:Eps11P family protein [Clostridia bacterium]